MMNDSMEGQKVPLEPGPVKRMGPVGVRADIEGDDERIDGGAGGMELKMRHWDLLVARFIFLNSSMKVKTELE